MTSCKIKILNFETKLLSPNYHLSKVLPTDISLWCPIQRQIGIRDVVKFVQVLKTDTLDWQLLKRILEVFMHI